MPHNYAVFVMYVMKSKLKGKRKKTFKVSLAFIQFRHSPSHFKDDK